MTVPEPEPPDVLDAARLMEDLRRRVRDKKARGLYGVDALMAASVEDDGEPFGLEELERLRELAVQRVAIAVAASDKPVVGGLVTRLKRMLVRGTSQPVYSLSAQATAFNGALLAYLSSLAREVARLERQVSSAVTRLDAAAGSAEHAGAELGAALERLGAAEDRLAALAGAALPERVARLEGPAATTAGAPAPEAVPAAPPAPMAGDPVRLRLEAIEAEEDPGAAARYAAYAATGGAGARVVVLGGGSGRRVEGLPPGTDVVEADGELVAAARRAGREVRHADPVAYAEALAPGSVDRIIVPDLVERLEGPELMRLARAVARALAPDGAVAVEGRHPEALLAIGREFWRDAGRRRPVHPDAVRMALEAAGLGATSTAFVAAAGDAPDGAVEGSSVALLQPRRYVVHAAR